jgi:alpha-1,3-glucan synthase
MLSATSYQIVLLSGSNGQINVQLYIIGAVFFGASVIWYLLSRFKPSIWVLSLPWFFFSAAFFLIGLPYISKTFLPAHDILSSAATWAYAVASAAGFAFFGLNFGEEAGAATQVWILRACIVQGSQQIWVTALWYWGDKLNNAVPGIFSPWWIACIVWSLSALCFLFMILLLRGLPGGSLIREFVWGSDHWANLERRVLPPDAPGGS